VIEEDDAALAAALEDLSIPTLMLSLVHMTGDPKWIRGDVRPQGLFPNPTGFQFDRDESDSGHSEVKGEGA
jgi:4-hydroxyacetophenone monooxygenase